MKTYMFLANGFEEVEALTPWDILTRAGADITTVSINETKEVTGTHNLTISADTTIDNIPQQPEENICVILPGGMPGTSNLDINPIVEKYILQAYKTGHIAAICAAPSILGKRNLLANKEATSFPSFQNTLTDAILSDKRVVTDSNITTARGMGVAFEFGIELIRVLFDDKKANEVAASTQAEI